MQDNRILPCRWQTISQLGQERADARSPEYGDY